MPHEFHLSNELHGGWSEVNGNISSARLRREMIVGKNAAPEQLWHIPLEQLGCHYRGSFTLHSLGSIVERTRIYSYVVVSAYCISPMHVSERQVGPRMAAGALFPQESGCPPVLRRLVSPQQGN